MSSDSSSPDLSNVRDLQQFPELRWLDRHKWLPIIAYAIGCFAIAGVSGLVWGFVVSTLLVLHATALINSLGHVWGTRRYATADRSRNNAFLAVLTLGEGWHNNHHHAMSSMRQGFFWWEVDITYYTLRAAQLLGLIWDVRKPSSRALAGPRVLPPASHRCSEAQESSDEAATDFVAYPRDSLELSAPRPVSTAGTVLALETAPAIPLTYPALRNLTMPRAAAARAVGTEPRDATSVIQTCGVNSERNNEMAQELRRENNKAERPDSQLTPDQSRSEALQ